MQSHRLFHSVFKRVPGSKPGDVGVVLAGAEVVFFDLRIIILAGELEGIADTLRDFGCVALAERLIRVGVYHVGIGVDQLAHAAEAVV